MKKLSNTATPEILLNIKRNMHHMSPAMNKLAKYILENYKKLDGIQIHQLAKESGVSEATITRFVKEIGFQNYQAFVLQMAKVNTKKEQSALSYGSIQEDDDVSTICNKVFSMNIQTITDTLSILDTDKIVHAVEAIADARRIMIFAQGRSQVTAKSLRQRLSRLGLSPCLYTDAHDGAIASSLADKEDVVIGISTYGRSRMVVANMERARKKGAVTIAVTSYDNTPLEQFADIVLKTVNNENLNFGYEPSCATVTQMIMLDCLYILLYLKDKEMSDKYINTSIEAVEEEKM